MNEQAAKAAAFLDLHHADAILVLPNAWDVASARIFEAAGASAIGTTSMGVSASLGLPDVQTISLERMVRTVERIAQSVGVPVNADMEAGYGFTTSAVVASIMRAVEAGAVGINLEDGTGHRDAQLQEPAVLAERIAAIREATDALGVHVVINARTDVFLAEVGPPGERTSEAVERCNAYREAGADCAFVPGGLDRETIRVLVEEVDAPLNVVANPAISVPVVPSVPELQELGVRRVSVGSGLMRAALAYTRRAAAELLEKGTYDVMRDELERPAAAAAYEAAIGQAGVREGADGAP